MTIKDKLLYSLQENGNISKEGTMALVGLAILEVGEHFRGLLKELECTRNMLQFIEQSIRESGPR